MKQGRHPGEGREPARKSWRRCAIPAFAGMTVAGMLAAGVALAQGPPPAPRPITLVDRPNATGGEALYVEHCMSCHGPNGMGIGLLGRRIQPALLELRDNLSPQYVIIAARQGIGNMPSIPRGEVSDEELKAIAEYLAAGPHEATK